MASKMMDTIAKASALPVPPAPMAPLAPKPIAHTGRDDRIVAEIKKPSHPQGHSRKGC